MSQRAIAMKQLLLNPYQQNFIRASLRSFEDALRQVNRFLEEGDERGILYYQKMTLDDERCQLAKEKVEYALQELASFVSELGLEPVEENPAQRIMALMSVSWENLAEIQVKRLQNYGDIDAETANFIGPKADRLARLAIEVSDFCFCEKPGRSAS